MKSKATTSNDLAGGLIAARFVPPQLYSSKDCIVALDSVGIIRHINAAWRTAMAAESNANLIGLNWPDIWPSHVRAAAVDAIARAHQELSSRFTADCLTLTGQRRWFEVTVSPVFDADGAVAQILVQASDVTGSKQRESGFEACVSEKETALCVLVRQLDAESQRLAAATARASHADKLRFVGQFVATTVHDFNNVLTVLRGATEMLRAGVTPDRRTMLLSTVDEAINRAAGLSRELLDLSRLEAEEPAKIEPSQFFSRIAGLLQYLITPGIALQLDVDPTCWPVLISPGRLQAAILNLASNASDAMPEGGQLTLAACNCSAIKRPPALPHGDYVRLSIRDTGIGMPPDVLARAGEVFFTTKGSGKGTGLGLSSAFELAAQCNGRVIITSEVGVGTAINLYLPRASVVDAAASPLEAIDPAQHGRATILIAEPDAVTSARLAAMLKRLNYRVIETAREDVACALLASGIQLDLACIGLQLSQGSGIELAGHLREAMPSLPLIFLSESSSIPALPDQIVFRKPIFEALLAQTILEKLGRRPASVRPADAFRESERVRDKIRNRKLLDAFDQWRSHCASHNRLPLPGDAKAFTRELLDNSCLIEVAEDHGVQNFRFVYAGSALTGRLGHELGGELITPTDQDLIGSIGSAYRRALRGAAYFDYARFSLGQDRMTVIERLILPLSDDGTGVSHLLGLVIFDEITNLK